MCRLEVSAYVSRQTRKSHSGGRRFEPVQLHQFHQELTKRRAAFGSLFFAFDSNVDSNRVSKAARERPRAGQAPQVTAVRALSRRVSDFEKSGVGLAPRYSLV